MASLRRVGFQQTPPSIPIAEKAKKDLSLLMQKLHVSEAKDVPMPAVTAITQQVPKGILKKVFPHMQKLEAEKEFACYEAGELEDVELYFLPRTLKTLILNCKITDDQVPALQDLVDLEHLEILGSDNLSEREFYVFSYLSSLRYLSLAGCKKLKDLRHVNFSKNLEYLDVSGCRVTQESLKSLVRLPNLICLVVNDIAPSTSTELREALPHLELRIKYQ